LTAQRGFLDGCGRHIAGQREIGRLELEQLVLRHGVQILHRAEIGAPDIRSEAHRELVGHQRKLGLRSLCWNRRHLAWIGNQKLRGCRIARDLRKKHAALGQRVVVGDLDRALGRLQGRIMLDRLPDEIVERRRLKRGPPLRGNVGAADEVLTGNARSALAALGRHQATFGCGQLSRQIGVDRRRRYRRKIRPDCAA
jgi:hypothetical protein